MAGNTLAYQIWSTMAEKLKSKHRENNIGESRSHKMTASRLSKKFKTTYNKGKGADIKTDNIAIEVETSETVSDASRQLQGYKKPVYVAGTNKDAVNKALERYKDTTIGVMDNQGKIIKKSSR